MTIKRSLLLDSWLTGTKDSVKILLIIKKVIQGVSVEPPTESPPTTSRVTESPYK